MSVTGRLAWVFGLAALLWLGAIGAPAAPVAEASNFGGCTGPGQPCFANNSNHGFAYQVGPRMRAAMERTRVQSYHTTNLHTHLTTREAADVFFLIDTLDPHVAGVYRCVQFSTLVAQACHRAEVRFNGPAITGFNDDELTWLACHETGHSVGLWHPTGDAVDFGCMIPWRSEERWLRVHNTAHINSRY